MVKELSKPNFRDLDVNDLDSYFEKLDSFALEVTARVNWLSEKVDELLVDVEGLKRYKR